MQDAPHIIDTLTEQFKTQNQELLHQIKLLLLESSLESRKIDSILHKKIAEINDQMNKIYKELTELMHNLNNTKNKHIAGIIYNAEEPTGDLFKKEEPSMEFD
jgi:uncharacterized coiled-coil DUF342 family protein